MSTSENKMLNHRVDRMEQRMGDWDKLAHGLEATMLLMLKEQQIMKKDIESLKEGQIQLALGQAQLMRTTSEIQEQQGKMMAILLQLIDRIP